MKLKYAHLSIIFLLCMPRAIQVAELEFNPEALGGFSISIDCFLFICNSVEHGRPILELGSGSGTNQLSRYFRMHSIEHNPIYCNKYDAHYIFAPIKQYDGYRWFDREAIKSGLPEEYDLILIDGPTGDIGRQGFLHNLYLFNTQAILVFDDAQRPAEMNLLKATAKKLNRPYKFIQCSDGKAFGVIYPQ